MATHNLYYHINEEDYQKFISERYCTFINTLCTGLKNSNIAEKISRFMHPSIDQTRSNIDKYFKAKYVEKDYIMTISVLANNIYLDILENNLIINTSPIKYNTDLASFNVIRDIVFNTIDEAAAKSGIKLEYEYTGEFPDTYQAFFFFDEDEKIKFEITIKAPSASDCDINDPESVKQHLGYEKEFDRSYPSTINITTSVSLCNYKVE